MYGDAFVGPAVTQPRRDRLRSFGIAALAALLCAAAGSAFVSARSTQSWFPKAWDPRVAPIAAAVSRLRGLAFVHPVAIEYLAPKDFQKQLGTGSDLSATDRAEVTREAAVFRALGLLGGKVDLLKAESTSQASGTLAFYDPAREEIIVRGATLDVAHRVTVAHELTHVLQDQHFNLPKLQKAAASSKTGDSGALKGLVEGDAVRIQNDYVKQLSAADNKEYQREDDAESARIGKETASVPDIVDLLSAAPYEFGPATIQVLFGAGGNSAVNDALTGPTLSTEVFTEPGDVTPPVFVADPLPSPDGVKVGAAESFGPFELFLTLAMRIDPGEALATADLVAGGRALTFRSQGETCYRVVLAPTNEPSRTPLLRAVSAWAKGRARTAVDSVGDRVGFTACDPGQSAPAPKSQRFHDATQILSFRSEVAVGGAENNASGDLARCVGRVFLELPGAERLVLSLGNDAITPTQQTALQGFALQSASECRLDPQSGLP